MYVGVFPFSYFLSPSSLLPSLSSSLSLPFLLPPPSHLSCYFMFTLCSLCAHSVLTPSPIRSVPHRTIKLFFIGDGMRGKTTLLRRLRGLPEEKVDRTEGIDIADWHYPEHKKISFSSPRAPVHFLAWDFAGQVTYQ